MPVLPNLAAAPWLIRPQTQAVLAALRAAGHDARVVGGAVRNALMGLPVADIDIATPAMPEEVVHAATAVGLQVIPTGLRHGTVTVMADGIAHEVTTLRRDVETDGRHATVAFTHDWAADAARRDFTINALYCNAAGDVYDPLGGYPDVEAHRVRFIGSADARIAEDYLRILRFFRFQAQYGVGPPDAADLGACIRGIAGLDRLSAERIRAELVKLILAPGALAALDAMFEHGLLVAVLGAVPRLPQLARLVTTETAAGVVPEAMRRLACLSLHGPEDADRLAQRLRLSTAERDALARPVAPLSRHLDADLTAADAHGLLYRMGEATWRDAVLVRWAWSGSDPGDTLWLFLASLPGRWSPPVPPVRGADLLALGLPPGPRVGAILRQLEAEWIAGDFAAGRNKLLARARELMA